MGDTKKATWLMDSAHSELAFKVRHMKISNVKGVFKKFNAEINGADFKSSKVKVTIDSDSITTNNEARDKHLHSADFFETENHKELIFDSTSLDSKGDNEYTLTGMLTIRGKSNEVKLDVEYGGVMKDPMSGKKKMGFSVSGKINRKDWGLNWNAPLEAGGVLVSNEVKINAELQFIKQD